MSKSERAKETIPDIESTRPGSEILSASCDSPRGESSFVELPQQRGRLKQPGQRPGRRSLLGFGFAGLGLLISLVASCGYPNRSQQSDLDQGWPQAQRTWQETTVLPVGWEIGKQLWAPAYLEPIHVPLPTLEGAVIRQADNLCVTCHEAYVTAFAHNPHRQQGCESCHGPASIHLETRGQPGSILSLRNEQPTAAGIPLNPAQRAEICLQCHDCETPQPDVPCVQTWRSSKHAHQGVSCSDCHRTHYNVPPGTPAAVLGALDPSSGGREVALVQAESPAPLQPPTPSHAPSQTARQHKLGAVSPDSCYKCHAELQNLEHVPHPHQLGVPLELACTKCHNPAPQGQPREVPNHPTHFDCLTCHDAHGNILAETRKDLCLKCHDQPHRAQWYGSPHDAGGVGCTDCHNPHPKQGPPMQVDQPGTCYRCHSDKSHQQDIAHAHQILGPNNLNCNSCHDPHGRITQFTRRDACLKCHQGAPTMAWHSSIHERAGVACADCHNAHPQPYVQQVLQLSHTHVDRPRRLPMNVPQPEVCYKCHAKIYGQVSMPSHHPIQEGKMVCSDCHDSHGQSLNNLKEDSVNDLCYQCHMEKEGPFAYEHPPVTENCGFCHNPHGTVANNLLKQPTTFLCLRCHSGHSTHEASPQCLRCHFVNGVTTNVGGGPLDPPGVTNPTTRQALFTDCTQCHVQIHGSDLPAGFVCGKSFRR